ncbi:MAG: T9SS type A sorting domain-containing protein [Bacteroidota bacterium]
MRSLLVLFLLLFSCFYLSAQVSLSCAGSTPSTMVAPTNSVVCNTTVVSSNNSNNPPVVEYIITDPNTLADDFVDDDNDPSTAPVAQMLGPAIIGTSISTTINPTNFGLTAGDQFIVTAVNYDLGQIQSLIDAIYNNSFLFVPCCTVVGAVLPGFCADLMAAGISQGSDIQNLNDLLTVFDQFNPVPGSTNSIEGFIGRINDLNSNASQVPNACGGNQLPICYAIDQGNVAQYDYRPVPSINNITDNCPTNADEIVVDASVNAGTLEYSLDGINWQASNTLIANMSTETVFVREMTCGEQVSQQYTISCVPLAVELQEFKGTAAPDGNHLYWQTTHEWQHDFFVLESATNGRTFSEIARIPGKGTPDNGSKYHFWDQDFRSTTNYYRLKMVDQNGAAAYSSIAIIHRQNALASLAVSPNPASSFIDIRSLINWGPDSQLTLFDHNGKQLKKQQLESRSDHAIRWSIADLPSGLYWLTYTNGQQQQSVKFLKM